MPYKDKAKRAARDRARYVPKPRKPRKPRPAGKTFVFTLQHETLAALVQHFRRVDSRDPEVLRFRGVLLRRAAKCAIAQI